MSIKKRLLTISLSVGMLMGLGMSSASAYTVYYGNYYWGHSNGVSQVKYCYRDYNWWEETFYRNKDGYYACGLRYVNR